MLKFVTFPPCAAQNLTVTFFLQVWLPSRCWLSSAAAAVDKTFSRLETLDNQVELTTLEVISILNVAAADIATGARVPSNQRAVAAAARHMPAVAMTGAGQEHFRYKYMEVCQRRLPCFKYVSGGYRVLYKCFAC